MFLRCRTALAVLTLLVAASASVHAAPAALPPVEHFFDNPGFSGAVLSPDARFLAVRTSKPDGRDMLAVVNLETMALRTVGNFADWDIGDFAWVNNERLMFNTTDSRVGQGDIEFAPGLYAINRDGSDFRQLVERHDHLVRDAGRRVMLPWYTYMLHQRGAQNSNSVYVRSSNYTVSDVPDVELLKLDTVSGRAVRVSRPPRARSYLLDQNGEPRIALAIDEGKQLIWYLDPQNGEWRKLGQSALYAGADGYSPMGFGPDGTLYVRSRVNSDKTALYRLDLATGQVDPTPVLRMTDYDFSGQLLGTSDKLLGVRLYTDAESTEWFDPAMKALQERIDAKLPGTVNLISLAPRAQTPWVLVQSYSDIQPPITLLFNTASGAFKLVGDAHQKIDPARMGHQQLLHVKARDGRSIPVWLTLPHGDGVAGDGKNLPMVVLVHGGPYVRGTSWGWNPDSQFLASRGYAVLEPEFRGSTGFGFEHFKAGWKQWGLGMQNDVADATRWAIGEGVADAKRICIAGASYGGYATLMGLVNDPDLYRCGVEWAGVTDIDLMFSGHWSFASDQNETWKEYGMPLLIGDPKADHAQFQATSPLAQAARITQPLLMAYGTADRRVPIYHGKKFYAAVKATNPKVEYVQYEEEGHGWALPKNRFDFWTRVERFLDKNIGAGSDVSDGMKGK
jgi:dipeptidyl aminopeptidase/acylaminoacyl peptidase